MREVPKQAGGPILALFRRALAARTAERPWEATAAKSRARREGETGGTKTAMLEVLVRVRGCRWDAGGRGRAKRQGPRNVSHSLVVVVCGSVALPRHP